MFVFYHLSAFIAESIRNYATYLGKVDAYLKHRGRENRLANCCSDESVVTQTARVNGSVTTSEDEAVSSKPGSQHPSAPDEGAVALATLLGENSCRRSTQRT